MDFVINRFLKWSYLNQVILTLSDIVKNVFHLICQAICDENEKLNLRVNLLTSTLSFKNSLKNVDLTYSLFGKI